MKKFTVVMMAGGVEPFIVHSTTSSPEAAVLDARSKLGFEPDWPDLVGVFEGHLVECPLDEALLTNLIDDEEARLETIRDWHDDVSRIGSSPRGYQFSLASYRPQPGSGSDEIV